MYVQIYIDVFHRRIGPVIRKVILSYKTGKTHNKINIEMYVSIFLIILQLPISNSKYTLGFYPINQLKNYHLCGNFFHYS